MAYQSKLRLNSVVVNIRLNSFQKHRHFSSILNPDSKTPLSSKEKTRAALSLLKSEKNPERIIEICRAASLTPDTHLDRIAFSVAISKLKHSNYFHGIRSFLDESLTRPDWCSERFVSHSIVLYGQAGMVDEAIQTFHRTPDLGVERTVKSLNSLLFSCVLAGDYDQVKRVFVEFPKNYGIEPNLETYNTVIKGFCESGSTSSVYSVMAEMERKGVRPNALTFGTWVAGFYREEKFDDVGKVLEMMKKKYDMTPGLSIYNIRIQSLCKLRRSVEAKALLDGMLSREMKPNSVTYCHLIHGFCKEGNLDEAKSLFKKMVNCGCQPNSDCYFTLMYFLCQGGDFETALKVCEESMAKGWVPNFSTMKSLVNGLVSVEKVDEAREIVGKMKEKFSKFADTWNEIEEGFPK